MKSWKDIVKNHHQNAVEKGDDIILPFIAYDIDKNKQRWFDDVLYFERPKSIQLHHICMALIKYMGTEIFSMLCTTILDTKD